MRESSRKRAARPDVLPWQAALMVMCVTAAGLLHEHADAIRPVVASLHTGQVRSGTAPVTQPVAALNVVAGLGR